MSRNGIAGWVATRPVQALDRGRKATAFAGSETFATRYHPFLGWYWLLAIDFGQTICSLPF